MLAQLRPLLSTDAAAGDPLAAVLRTIIGLVPAVSGATLSRRRTRDAYPRTVASTDLMVCTLDVSQFRTGQGPIIDAIAGRVAVNADDLMSDPRWPRLAHAVADAPPQACLAVPVHDGLHRVTILSLYSTGPLSPPDRERIPLLTTALELVLAGLAHRDRVGNLEHATVSNRRIGIAIGVLMAHDRGTDQQAFESLSTASQSLNRKLVDVAEDVIFAGTIPNPATPPRAGQRRTPPPWKSST